MPDSTITGYNYRVTVYGDTFDGIALSEYNEEKMAHYIINANPDYSDVLIFDAGITLKIPIVESVDLPDTLPPWRRGQ